MICLRILDQFISKTIRVNINKHINNQSIEKKFRHYPIIDRNRPSKHRHLGRRYHVVYQSALQRRRGRLPRRLHQPLGHRLILHTRLGDDPRHQNWSSKVRRSCTIIPFQLHTIV